MNALLMPDVMAYLFSFSLLALFVGCLLPAHWLPPLPNDKYLHFFAYAFLSLFAVFFTHSFNELLLWQVGLMIVGILVEAVQHFVPGRQFCWRDILANFAGIAAVGTVYWLFTL
jgi:VanZ family protein